MSLKEIQPLLIFTLTEETEVSNISISDFLKSNNVYETAIWYDMNGLQAFIAIKKINKTYAIFQVQ